MELFRSDATRPDREKFLEFLDRYSSRYAIDLMAYCLMPNHIHLLLVSREGRISEFMGTLKSRYSRWFNKQRGSKGTLYEKRFQSELVQDGKYFMMAFRYVVTNPHRAGLADPEKLIHPWNSLSELGDKVSMVDWSGLFARLENVTPDNVVEFLRADRHEQWSEAEKYRRSDRDIHIIGDDRFLERMLQRSEQPTRKERPVPGTVEQSEILDSVCQTFGIESKDRLCSTTQTRMYRDARFCAYYLLHVRSRLSYETIAEIMNVSPPAVSYGIRRLGEETLSEKQFSLLKRWNVEPGSI